VHLLLTVEQARACLGHPVWHCWCHPHPLALRLQPQSRLQQHGVSGWILLLLLLSLLP
jgi:hypothetical protein